MRIGFDAKRAFYNQSGLGNYCRNLLLALNANFPDNHYILYTPKFNNGLFELPGDNFSIRLPQGVMCKTFPSLWRSFAMPEEISKDKLDIYHGLSHELPYGIRKTNVKSVVTIHDLIFLRYPELYGAVDRFIYHRKFRHACNQADRIISVSRQTADDIVAYFEIDPNKIDVVYQGCSPFFFEKADEAAKKYIRKIYHLPDRYILYVGTIEERKNLLSLVKGMHIGKIDMPLIVLGRKTGYFDQVQRYINQNHLNFITFHDTINNQELPAIYQMADAFVYPSLFEGFGIPVLESLVSGLPVITSKGGCFAEAGGPGSIYIDPLNPDEIADALTRILGDDELRKTMAETGMMYASRFNPDKTAANMMQVYHKLLAG